MRIINDQILRDVLSYNEAEVRLHIIDPVLKMLGYPGNDDVYLKLEEKLEFPYHIGHRSKKDLPLGYADYRAGLKGRRGSFIVEAKAGKVIVSSIDIEQAHSYAAHAKVGANYFLLCGGHQIEVFETLSGSECKPIVSIPIIEIDKRFHELENILSPINLEKNCQVHCDLALKLCSGLGSKTEIHSGEYGMDYWTYRIYMNGADMTEQFKVSVPQLADFEKQLEMLANEFPLRIAGGSAERNENGQIVAHVSFLGATKNNLAGMKLLGVDEMTFATDEKFLSTDPSSPSVFESTADFKMDQGTMMPQLLGGMMALEADVDGDFFVSARIYKDRDHLVGEYVALTNYRFGAASISLELDYIGKFNLRLMN